MDLRTGGSIPEARVSVIQQETGLGVQGRVCGIRLYPKQYRIKQHNGRDSCFELFKTCSYYCTTVPS